MLPILRLGVIAASFFSLASLIVLVLRTFVWGRRRPYSEPKGKAFLGVLYALGKGLMPWEKESTSKNLLTYAAGNLYHIGIFAGLMHLSLQVISWEVGALLVSCLRIFMVCGLAAGSGLLLRRTLKTVLREISCPDDFASNILVDLFLAAALLDSFFPGIKPVFYALSIALFLYIPIGKIRHCFFFFYSRILFGLFFGKRSVLPQSQRILK